MDALLTHLTKLDGQNLLIVGNPGIGKSWLLLLNALLWLAIRRDTTIQPTWTALRKDDGTPYPVVLRDVEGFHFFGPALLPALLKGERVVFPHDIKKSLQWTEPERPPRGGVVTSPGPHSRLCQGEARRSAHGGAGVVASRAGGGADRCSRHG